MASSNHSEKLSEAALQKLEAIVFDTNSFPSGSLELRTLQEWGRRASLADLEVWVPESVLWELAEHAAASWEEHRVSTNRARKAMQRAGLDVPAQAPYESRESVVDAVESAVRSLMPAVRVLSLDSDVAQEALRDQVLQRPPAKKKHDVKTGAADSAWIRQVLKTAGDDVEKFIIVGADKDVYQAFEAWNLGQPCMVPLRNLQETLFVLETPESSIREAIVAFLQGVVSCPLDGGKNPDGTLFLGDIEDPAKLVMDWRLDQVHDVSIVRLDAFVGMNRLSIDRLTHVVKAQVFFFVEAEYSGWKIDQDGETVAHSSAIPQVMLRDVLNFTLEDGSVRQAQSETGQAQAFAKDDHAFSESWEAFDALVEAMSLVPGLDSSEIQAVGIGEEFSCALGDFTLTLISEHGGGDPDWSASITLSRAGWSESLDVWCEWDGSRVPYEMPDLLPAYVIVADNVHIRAPGEWAAPVWMIDRIWPTPPEETQATDTASLPSARPPLATQTTHTTSEADSQA